MSTLTVNLGLVNSYVKRILDIDRTKLEELSTWLDRKIQSGHRSARLTQKLQTVGQALAKIFPTFISDDEKQVNELLREEFVNYLASRWHAPDSSPKYPNNQKRTQVLLDELNHRSLVRPITTISVQQRKNLTHTAIMKDPDARRYAGGTSYFYGVGALKKVIELLSSQNRESAILAMKDSQLGFHGFEDWDAFLDRLVEFSRVDHSVQGIIERTFSELKSKFLQAFKKEDAYQDLFDARRNDEPGIDAERRELAGRFLDKYPEDFTRAAKLIAFIIQAED